jgi:hypothetical protein
VATGAELLGGPAGPRAGGSRRWQPAEGRGIAAQRQPVVRLPGAGPAAREAGETEARPQRNRQAPKLAGRHEAIRAEVARRPDATLEELRAWLLREHGVSASMGLMWNTLARLGLTLKKSRAGRPSGIGRTWSRSARPGVPGRAAWTRDA